MPAILRDSSHLSDVCIRRRSSAGSEKEEGKRDRTMRCHKD